MTNCKKRTHQAILKKITRRSNMKKILTVESSPNRESSASRKATQMLIERLKKLDRIAQIRHRDLDEQKIPHLDAMTIGAYYTPEESRSKEMKEAIKLSDSLTDELLWSDEIILSIPMWNFGIPSVTKAWLDHIARPGKTFSYTSSGINGLAVNKRVYIVLSSGGIYSQGDYMAYDQVVPYLKTFFGFIGITQVDIFRVEGTSNDKNKEAALNKVKSEIERIVQ